MDKELKEMRKNICTKWKYAQRDRNFLKEPSRNAETEKYNNSIEKIN